MDTELHLGKGGSREEEERILIITNYASKKGGDHTNKRRKKEKLGGRGLGKRLALFPLEGGRGRKTALWKN